MTNSGAAGEEPRRSARVAGLPAEEIEVEGADGCSRSARNAAADAAADAAAVAARSNAIGNRFFEFPLEVRNNIWGQTVNRTNSTYPHLVRALINYTDHAQHLDPATLTAEHQHIQWLLTTLSYTPELGPEFTTNFYSTTIIDFDFDDLTSPLYANAVHSVTGAFVFGQQMRNALGKINEMLARFRHFNLIVGNDGSFVTHVATDIFEDVVDRIMLPRANTAAITSIALDIGQIVSNYGGAQSTKARDLCNVMARIQQAPTTRLKLRKSMTLVMEDGSSAGAAAAQAYGNNLQAIEGVLVAAGVSLNGMEVLP